ncbi:AI-2E family transporter [Roseomonas sp. OT10]|uniref:AI-2E family transporter n=1 Tax=Roseomonas cutis TaxID=2897332 RepID=UPI001E5DD71E|nr:AI-2E family transporter [Roseomonas sp. OT10]UFN51315.1 AI-2E family transporter [Roseomonas sp. OT10]
MPPPSLARSTPARVTAAGVPSAGLGLLWAAGAVVAVLYVARDLLVPLALAVLLAFVLAPVVRLFRKARIPRVGAVLITVVLAFGVLAGAGLLMGRQLASLATDLPLYQARVSAKLSGLTGGGGLLDRATDMLHDLGENLSRQRPTEAAASRPAEVPPMPVEVRTPSPGPLELVQSVIAPLLGPVAHTGIVIVFVIFLLLYREDLRDRLIKLMGSRDLQRTTAAMDDAAARLSRYFLAQTALNASFGLMISIGLWFIGIPNPVLWGMLAGLMRFVPFIGGFIAAAFPALLAVAIDPGWTTLIWTLGLFLLAEPLMGHVIEPMVYGHSTGLSPIAVLIATAFWAWLWGPLGMLLATPLTVGLVVLGRHVDRLEFLDVLLGDRAALAPPEAFYQRALAGDEDGLIEQADERLRNTTLAAYYDEVALAGLALAQADAARDALKEDRLELVRERVDELVEELADHDENEIEPAMDGPVAPAPEDQPTGADQAAASPASLAEAWKAPGAVLCLAGRGRFDAQAAAMLTQVLERRGFGTRILPPETLRDPRLGEDAAQVRAIILSVIDGGSSVASVRYALRRLRRRFPDAMLLLGAWGAERGGQLLASLERDEESLRPVLSLREAASLCEAEAREAPALPATSRPVVPEGPARELPDGAPGLLSPA